MLRGLSNTDPISTIRDLSGKGHDLTQGTSAKQPTFRTNIQSGRAIARFDGTDDEVQCTTGATTGNPAHSLFVSVNQSGSGAPDGVLTHGLSGAGLSTSTIGNYLGKIWYGGQNDIAPLSSTALPSVFTILSKTFDGSSLVGYLNGSSEATETLTYAIGDTKVALGVFFNNFGFVGADIGEAMIYNRALTSAERHLLERYLGARWGVAIP